MELCIDKITHDPSKKPPLTVTFSDERNPKQIYSITVDGSQIQTFQSFQRVCLNRLGLLVRHHSEDTYRAQAARQEWSEDVQRAIEAGRAGD